MRLTSGYVARNSFHYGGWGEEESYGDLPFRAGQHFEILILCEPSEFKVFLIIFFDIIFHIFSHNNDNGSD